MDVYALTRKERPRVITMAPLPSANNNNNGNNNNAKPAVAATTTAATTAAPQAPSSSSWVSTDSSISSHRSAPRMSRPTSHGPDHLMSNTTSGGHYTGYGSKGRQSIHRYGSWSTGSGASSSATIHTHQSSLQSSIYSANSMSNGLGSHGRARSSLLLGKSVSAGRVATPGVDSHWGEVTGLPTRVHWKPDDQADRCAAFTCQKPFTLFERRHHCRRCGEVFCAGCSANLLPLDQDAEYHPAGVMSRVCNRCMSDAQKAVARKQQTSTRSNTSGTTSIASSPGASTDSTIISGSTTAANHAAYLASMTSINETDDRMLLRTPEQTNDTIAATTTTTSTAANTTSNITAAPLATKDNNTAATNPLRRNNGQDATTRHANSTTTTTTTTTTIPHDWTWSTF
ncbi:hypothetical protein BDF22DRAFT_162746 [Syncephalis plumigaleata]|nr:hypothetical protein BDF22DRAFT_162746 [Syncephalis plumigaleata]